MIQEEVDVPLPIHIAESIGCPLSKMQRCLVSQFPVVASFHRNPGLLDTE